MVTIYKVFTLPSYIHVVHKITPMLCTITNNFNIYIQRGRDFAPFDTLFLSCHNGHQTQQPTVEEIPTHYNIHYNTSIKTKGKIYYININYDLSLNTSA